MPRAPRAHRWLLALLVGLAVLRGGYWAAALVTPSPIDEVQHFDYVRSLARLEGIPTVGRDQVADEVLAYAKASPTGVFRSFPYPADLDARAWDEAPAAESYEGIQGPTYYALLAPFYWLGRIGGIEGSWFAVRLGSVLLGALSIPVAWLLARRLLPRQPAAWLLPPVLLAGLNAVNAGSATVGNDVVVLTGSAVVVLLVLRAVEERSVAGALVAGATGAAVVLGKTTALAALPIAILLALPRLTAWWRTGDRRGLRRAVVAAAGGFVAVIVPWVLWNLHAYGALTGAEEAEAITGSLQRTYPADLETLRMHAQEIRHSFWQAQLLMDLPYQRIWEFAALGLVGLGFLVAWRRRGPLALEVLAWGGSALPLAFATTTAIFMIVLGETGLILGRYVWAALVPLVLAMGIGAAVLGGRRIGVVLVCTVLAVSLWQERTMAHSMLRRDYERGLVSEELAPVIEQSWHDGYVAARAIELDLPCPAEVLDVGLQHPRTRLVVIDGEGAQYAERTDSVPASFSRYRLERPVEGTTLVVPRSAVAVSLAEVEPAASLYRAAGDPEVEGDPLVRAHCPVEDAGALRFEQLFDPGHLPLSRTAVQAWPTAWAGLGTAAAVASAVWALAGRRRRSGVDVDDADAFR